MCNAIMNHDCFPFTLGEEVNVEYLGICSGNPVYIVRKEDNHNISEVIFGIFLRLIKDQPIPSLERRERK